MSPSKYAKGIARSDEIVEVALRVVSEKGYSAATIRELAEEAGLSKTGLLHHFGTKEALFAEILRRRDAVDEEDLASASHEGASVDFADLPRRSAAVPGLVQLYARFSAEASERRHPAHEFFAERFERSRARTAAVLRAMQDAGTLRRDVDAHLLASAVVAMLDGLQVQWLYDDRIDMAEVLSTTLAAIGVPPTDSDAPDTGDE